MNIIKKKDTNICNFDSDKELFLIIKGYLSELRAEQQDNRSISSSNIEYVNKIIFETLKNIRWAMKAFTRIRAKAERKLFIRELIQFEVLRTVCIEIITRTENTAEKRLYCREMVVNAIIVDYIETLFGIKFDRFDIGLYKRRSVLCACGRESIFMNNSFIYSEDEYQKMIYYCEDCGSYCCVHSGTNIPLGFPVDKETRLRRQMVHAKLEKLRDEIKCGKSYAYIWLAEEMGLSDEETHAANFDLKLCERAIGIIDNKLRENRQKKIVNA